MAKVSKEKENSRVALEKEKSISRNNVIKERERFISLMSIADINNNKIVASIKQKSFESVQRERKKRAEVVRSIMKKTSTQISRILIKTEEKLDKKDAQHKKKEFHQLSMVEAERKKNQTKIEKVQMMCTKALAKERNIRSEAISFTLSKLKHNQQEIKLKNRLVHKVVKEAKHQRKQLMHIVRKESCRRKRAESVAESRLIRMRRVEDKCNVLHDNYIETESETRSKIINQSTNCSKQFELRKVRTVGRRGGGSKWPIPVVQLVIEQIVNGTPPSSIRSNIASFFALTMPWYKIKELPGLSFIRECRVVIQIMGETLTAHRLASAEKWDQLFTDGTSRRQIALQNLVVGLLDDEVMKPLILSSSIISENETSEKQVEAIISKLKTSGERLDQWATVLQREYPDSTYKIPNGKELHIGKLGFGGAITTDTCNAAQKTKRLLVDEVLQYSTNNHVLLVDCWHHLRNVWLGGMAKSTTNFLNDLLADSLEVIDPQLRVSTGMEGILRACDKEFSLCANYPKGHGELFGTWIKENHPGALLLHVERTAGSRQDLVVEGAGAIFWNRPFWVEFLDERLRLPAGNILQENLFIVLTSVEMVALSRIYAIVHLSICLPIRWLAANSHTLAKYSWSIQSMGRVVDILEKSLEKISKKGALILDEKFMMEVFLPLHSEIEPFNDYWVHMFDKKQMSRVADKSSKVLHFGKLRSELFTPTLPTNIESSTVAKKLSTNVADALLVELRDTRKATSKYLSSSKSKCCWGNTSPEDRVAGLNKMAVNDPAERSFGALTGQLQIYGRISLPYAAGVSQVRTNGDLSRGFETTSSNKRKATKKDGFFHTLPEELRNSLIIMALEYSPETKKVDQILLSKQRAAKRQKEKLAHEHGLQMASEKYIDALYYYDKYGSPACWMNVKDVDREIKKLKSVSAKLSALKENIRIRVIGFGWSNFAHPWSKNGIAYSPQELGVHLKSIIKAEKKCIIPNRPPTQLPQRKNLPQLGTQTSDVKELDALQQETSIDFDQNARKVRLDRESRGHGDRYSELQPTTMPEIVNNFIGTRLDVCFKFVLECGGEELSWCQGTVVDISNGNNMLYPNARSRCYKKGEAVEVLWDAIDGISDKYKSIQKLQKTKWNKQCEGAWRLDVNVNNI